MHAPEVVDRAKTGQAGRVQRQLQAVLDRFAERGRGVRRPLRVSLEDLGVPGFTETQVQVHALHLQAGAVQEPWFPGLLVRQVAHASLTDAGQPSHDPAWLQGAFAAARGRTRDVRFLSAVGALNHHVRDLYAEDLGAFVDAESLGPFLDHLAALALADGSGVEVAYAVATLARRGAPVPAGLEAKVTEAPWSALTQALVALHPDPTLEELEAEVVCLVEALPEAP